MELAKSAVINDNAFPFIEYMISQDKQFPIPTLGFFLNHQEVFELDIDEFLNLLTPDKDQNLSFTKISELSDVNKKEVLGFFNKETGHVEFYIGKQGSNINDVNDIEHQVQIPIVDVANAVNDFDHRMTKWFEREE